MSTPTTDASNRRTLLHRRAYDVESFLEDEDHFRLVGSLRDVNPAGLWGIGDTEPMTVHHMLLELTVHARTLTIKAVDAKMLVHPQLECVDILPAYEQLVGLSIARGFTHKVREMFGGPKACTHFAALLNAMAPVAVQSLWGFYRHTASAESAENGRGDPGTFERNRDTCHVWATEGPMFAALAEGQEPPIPIWAQNRLRERGVPVELWRSRNSP